MSDPRPALREGFSLIELVVALIVLSVGLLSLASAIGFSSTQIRVADLATERTAAVQEAMEEMRATPFANVVTLAQGSALEFGEYSVWWTVTTPSPHLKRAVIYSSGPGYVNGQGWQASVTDSTAISIAEGLRPQ